MIGLHNPEVKKAFLKMILLWSLLIILFCFFIYHQVRGISNSIVNQNTAIIGQVIQTYPELEEVIVPIITQGVNEEAKILGEQALRQYGYEKGISITIEPMMKERFKVFIYGGGILLLIFLIPIFFVIGVEYSKIFSKVNLFAKAAEKVVEGDYSYLPDEEEGVFGILGLRFNQMAQRLKMSIEGLEKEKMSLKNVISDISHQLKTPLSSLIMFNELMISNEHMVTDTRRDFLLQSKQQLSKMEWLTISLLKMARVEVGAIVFKKEKVDVLAAVQEAVAILLTRIEEKEQKVQVICKEKEVSFLGDKEWLTEALTNIIKNSSEYTPYGGVISIKLSQSTILTRIIVQDSGEGISEKDIPHIFKRFYRGSNKVKAEGVGIGLALAKLIIEEQGGAISVRSIKGKGTEFNVTFLKGVL